MSAIDWRPATIDPIGFHYKPGVCGCGVRAIARELPPPRQSLANVKIKKINKISGVTSADLSSWSAAALAVSSLALRSVIYA